VPIFFVLRAWRWIYYLKAVKINLRFTDSYLLCAPSLAFSLFTPGQLGDFIKIEFLKRYFKIKRRDSISTKIIEKFLDFIVILFFFAISFAAAVAVVLELSLARIILFSALGIILIVILVIILNKYSKFCKKALVQLWMLVKSPRLVALGLGVTVLNWLALGLAWVLLGKLVGVNLSLLAATGLLCTTTIISVLSFVPGALGVLEFSLVFLLQKFLSVPEPNALLFAIVLRLYLIFIFLIGYFHTFWLKEKHAFLFSEKKEAYVHLKE